MTVGGGHSHAEHVLDVGERFLVHLRAAEAALGGVPGAEAVHHNEHAVRAEVPCAEKLAVQVDVGDFAGRERDGVELVHRRSVDVLARHCVEDHVDSALAEAPEAYCGGVLDHVGARVGEADVQGVLDTRWVVLCMGVR